MTTEAFPGIGGDRAAGRGLRQGKGRRAACGTRGFRSRRCGSTRSGAPAPRAATTSCASVAARRAGRARLRRRTWRRRACARARDRPGHLAGRRRRRARGRPAVGEGVVVVGGSGGELVALDAETGAKRWQVATGGEVLTAPTVAAGIVVVRTVDGRLRGLRIPTAARPGSMSSRCLDSRCAATARRSSTATWCLPASTTARWSRSR